MSKIINPRNGVVLNHVVLVLNANYSPLHICTAKRAICLHFLEKIEIIESYNEKIYSPSTEVFVPSVIKLKQIVKYNSIEGTGLLFADKVDLDILKNEANIIMFKKNDRVRVKYKN